MKKTALSLAVLLSAASAFAGQVTGRNDWDDPLELKGIRAEMSDLRDSVADKTPDSQATAATRKLMDRKRADLEALYRASGSGPIPDGKSDGLATLDSGTAAGRASEALFSFFWHGKVFDAKKGELVNRLVIGRAVKAKVFIGPSWLDGKPSVIIDYKGTSWVAGAIRDEIRMVSPGVYLGFAYVRAPDGGAPRADILFALDFTSGLPRNPTAP
ncbi:MAG: hypothetical protein ACHQ51_06255 [Elusimicrobiota bacterium]